ncbi:MAG TPA: hypothetical protein VHE34_04060 [Puia sp.]|uniref:globin domain-containing protein n=1 Tax=Puia sp. TaxID=2045100 RepID=UPI002CE38381|nr:hypothetical protein [Puia sp.]HVU94369.1 hypothetical protein [Puia sp.]
MAKLAGVNPIIISTPTLYEWAGGEEAIQKLFRIFYDKVLKDELIGPVFRNMSPDHPRHVGHFVAEVFGGPKKYTGEDGGSHAVMIGHHIGKMRIELPVAPKRFGSVAVAFVL